MQTTLWFKSLLQKNEIPSDNGHLDPPYWYVEQVQSRMEFHFHEFNEDTIWCSFRSDLYNLLKKKKKKKKKNKD